MVLEACREGVSIRVMAEGGSENWSILLRNVGSISAVEGGVAQPDALGTIIIPTRGVKSLVVKL